MAEDLTTLEERLKRKGTKTLTTTEGVRLIRLLRDLTDELDRRVGQGKNAVGDLDARLSPIEARLLLVDTLPANAPLGALIRLTAGTQAERLPLYLGNGPAQPLTKLTPTVV